MTPQQNRDLIFTELRKQIHAYAELPKQYQDVFQSRPLEERSILSLPMERELRFTAENAAGKPDQLRGAIAGLMEAINQYNEIAAVQWLNEGDPALFSVATGNVAELPLSAESLSYATRQIKYELGSHTRLLILPPELEPMIPRLAVRGWQLDYRILDFLESPVAWFLLTGVPGFSRRQDVPFELSVELDGDTPIVKAYEQATWFCSDPRAVWGSYPEDDGCWGR